MIKVMQYFFLQFFQMILMEAFHNGNDHFTGQMLNILKKHQTILIITDYKKLNYIIAHNDFLFLEICSY